MPGPRVAISATFTAEPLREPLEFLLHLLGWDEPVEFAPFHQVLQTLLDPTGPFARNRDGVNVVLTRAGDLPGAEFARALQDVAGQCIVCACPPPADSLERDLEEHLGGSSRIVYVNPELDHTVAQIFDPRAHELGVIPYTSEFFAAIALTLARQIHRLRGRPCKAIVLDCDDTLWRGVCGEDGPAGVILDEPRRALQDLMIEQRALGRLLAIASKNNDADVVETFRSHSEMPLTLGHFAARRINWDGKAASLQSLADELKLGVDSFLFIDDNPKECAEVQAELPQVATIALPTEATGVTDFLKHVWALDRPWSLTAEDQNRSAAYSEQTERTAWERQSKSLEDFIAGLQLVVEMEPLAERDIPRASQLMQRTNQMNFSTKRRTEEQLRDFLALGSGFVVRARDRFGDYGLVGLVLFEDSGEEFTIDTFLLSCRALGRGVEHRMLRHIGEFARNRGFEEVTVLYEAAERNAPARDLLTNISMSQAGMSQAPFQFASSDLASLVYRPTRNLVPTPNPDRDKAAVPRAAAAPNYQRIAELSTPEKLLAAIRKQKLGRAVKPTTNEPPRTELEQYLCTLWADLLSLPAVGIHDNFFDMGGHSLLAVQLVSRLHRERSVDLPLEAVYTGTLTVDELARSIELFQLEQFEDEDYAALLAEVENLTDEEAEALLARETGPKPLA